MSDMSFGEKAEIVGKLAKVFVVKVLWQVFLSCALVLFALYGVGKAVIWAVEHDVPQWIFFTVGIAGYCLVVIVAFIATTLWQHGWEYFSKTAPSNKETTS